MCHRHVGGEEPVQTVCGAPNRSGHRGPRGHGWCGASGDFKIKKTVRGVASCGMCCSKRELGLGTDHEGIWILPEDAAVGTPIAEYLGLTDTVIDLEITPNRPDCLSMVGFAREVGAMYGLDWCEPAAQLEESGESIEGQVSVAIDDAERCPRYTARLVRA
ncbi:MAG: hypothetical protein ACLTQI_02665 [Slackia sp.]